MERLGAAPAAVSSDGQGRVVPAGIGVHLFAAVSTILTAIIIYSIFTTGVRRGMDHVLSFGPQTEQHALTIAISELRQGLGSYIGYTSTIEELQKLMNQGAEGPNDPKLLPNISNGDLINEAIANAVASVPRTGFVSHGDLITMVYDDLGIVDYIKIAFSIFDFKIQSLYYLFFTVLSLSSAVFLVQYWRKPVAQVVLLASLFAFILELQTSIFNAEMPTFWGLRHCSTLALVPLWHLAFLLVYRIRLSLTSIVLAVIQVAIVVLAIKTRGSTMWVVIFLALLTAFLAFGAWRRSSSHERSATRLLKSLAMWPLMLMLAGLLADKLYTDSRLHPAYFTDDIMPYHGAWHSAYLGIAVSPSFPEGQAMLTRGWDRAGYDAALAYLKAKNFIATEAEYVSPWTNTYKMRLHDRTMRSAYLELVSNNPFKTLALYTYWKPLHIYVVWHQLIDSLPLGAWLMVLLGPLLLAVVTATLQEVDRTDVLVAVGLMVAALPFTVLPNMWAYASTHAFADPLLGFFGALSLGIWAIGLALLQRLRIPFIPGWSTGAAR
jgi:hypothetical protein